MNTNLQTEVMPDSNPSNSPVITQMRVIPVAGQDGMLLNLSGAHAPFFTRNLLVLTDSAGRTGVGEVPGGEKIRQTLEDAAALVVGQPVGNHLAVLQAVQKAFAERAGQWQNDYMVDFKMAWNHYFRQQKKA